MDELIELQSEFIYESIMIESSNKTSIIEKIKQLWQKFLNFFKSIRNKNNAELRENKQEIKEADDNVEYKDFSNVVKKVKECADYVKNYKNHETYVIGKGSDINYDDLIIKRNNKPEIAIKEIEKSINEIDKITKDINNLISKLDSRASFDDMTNEIECKDLINKLFNITNMMNKEMNRLISLVKSKSGDKEGE